jgi:hypothetical protein
MGGISQRRWKRRGIGLRFNVLLAGGWSSDLTLELKGNWIHDGIEFSDLYPCLYAVMLATK